MEFEKWITQIIETEKPVESIIAYYFGILQTEGGYSLYLTGFSIYSMDDSDWAGNSDFEPADKYCALPQAFSQLSWGAVLEKVESQLVDFMKTSVYQTSFLAKAQAIGFGFDDGDILILPK